MNTTKSANVLAGGVPTPEQLEKIHLQSKAPLSAEQVYCFSVQLCSDRPDRDFERFDTAALPVLAELFIGKTGICDHEWSARRQLARIFDTSVEQSDGASVLVAWAYMLRDEESLPVIEKIEAGIHREVSVGCAMGEVRCSICGSPYGTCEHRKGESYGGETCYGVLCDPRDAYEFSFVAVPAQPEAGVRKGFGEDARQKELERDAALGQRYLASLKGESVRLALSLGIGVERTLLEAMVRSLDEGHLLALNKALRELRDKKYPVTTQLPGTKGEPFGIGSEFLI